MTCSNQYINPLGLGSDGNDSDEQEQGGDPTVGMGTGRRKKRSTVKRTLRNKRQEASTEQGMSENVTLVSRQNLHRMHTKVTAVFIFNLLNRVVCLLNLI